MKTRIVPAISLTGLVALLAVALPAVSQAQGTFTFLSTLGQASSGTYSIGSDSRVAVFFQTGANPGGYVLNSIQFAMAVAYGNPSGFGATLYETTASYGLGLAGELGRFGGSSDPRGNEVYSYSALSQTHLAPYTTYAVVLSAETPVSMGDYQLHALTTGSLDTVTDWRELGTFYVSPNGDLGSTYSSAQLAITATAVPEPGSLALIGMGGAAGLFLLRRGKHPDNNQRHHCRDHSERSGFHGTAYCRTRLHSGQQTNPGRSRF